MPELPEVETTCRGILPHVVNRPLGLITIRDERLRYPVSPSLESITGDTISTIRRRGKYLIFKLAENGHLLVHLGMSGSLRITSPGDPCRQHDHILIDLPPHHQLRYHDPRRFGLFLHLPTTDPEKHPLIASLGPEPLSPDFHPQHLIKACRQRRTSIKAAIMNAKIVVGVGNIYASEALFRAGIRPRTAAHRVAQYRLTALTRHIRDVLTEAIEQGGTTLRDFIQSDGQPGYFRQHLFVYERGGEACRRCEAIIQHAVVAQRSTYWCPRCQSP